MEGINRVPVEIVKIIPTFEGDARQLPLFIKKCEYVINKFAGGDLQNEYLFHVITSRLAGPAANLVGERDHLNNWEDLKNLLSQHFGDPRTEECLLLELEALRILRGESYLDFCHRVQHYRSILLAKVTETISDVALRIAKNQIYTHTSLNVFLYNLPPYLVRLVRLRNVTTLEGALKVVMEEQNFQTVYDIKNPSRIPRNSRTNSNSTEGPERNFRNDNLSNQTRQNVNIRPPNNFNNSQQIRFSNNNSHSFRNQFQQPSRAPLDQQISSNTPFSASQNQQRPVNIPPRAIYGHVSSQRPSGSNTDVTMRTASSRRVNYTENLDTNNTFFEPNGEPTPGSSQGYENGVENFCIRASRVGNE